MGKQRKIVGLWPAERGSVEDQGTDSDALARPAPTSMIEALELGRGERGRDLTGSPSDAPAAAVQDAPSQPQAETRYAAMTAPAPEISGETLWTDDADTLLLAAPQSPGRGFNWLVALVAIGSVGWLAALGWIASSGFRALPSISLVPTLVVSACAPIAVGLLALLLFERLSLRSLRQHATLLEQIRASHAHMVTALSSADDVWRASQDTLQTRSDSVVTSVIDAASRIESITATLDQRMHDVMHNSSVVTTECDNVSRTLQGLVQAMPKVEDVARRAAESMRVAGQSAYQFGGQLEARIAAVQTEAAAAEKTLLDADALLAARVEALIAATGVAESSAQQAGERFSAILTQQRDAALATLADLASGMETSISAAQQRLNTARSELSGASEAQLAALAAAVAEGTDKISAINASIEQASSRNAELASALDQLVTAAQSRFSALEQAAQAHLGNVSQAIAHVDGESEKLEAKLAAQAQKSADLSGEASRLIEGLGSVAHGTAQQLPALFDDIDARLERARTALDALPGTLSTELEEAAKLVSALETSRRLLAEHQDGVGALSATMAQASSIQAQQAAATQATSEKIAQDLIRLREELAPAVGSSLRETEEAAHDIAARIREAMANIVSDSATELGSAIEASLAKITSDRVVEQLNQIGVTADEAVTAANAATERLMHQIITITESTEALEQRARMAESHVAEQGKETLARQLAQISESMQSTAVDLTRILDSEVADHAWAAYLRGDKGIFTRRAVRLLSAAEARDVLKRYQDDADFRAYVNRYVHDFENMLRAVMDTKDGNALSVTLLSSDIGKLYVALAQAIERLRS